jgi:hypothetical protein
MIDVLKPNPSLVVKIGSLIVHYQEALGPKGHPLDWEAIKSIEGEPDVQEWFAEMTKKGFLPVKR